MRVTDPDGVEWEVSRQWLHVPRWRAPRVQLGSDFPSLEGEDFLVGLALAVLAVVIVFVLLVVGLPLLPLLAGFVFAVGGLVIRVVFRRPWLVRARSDGGELEWRVRGGLGSRRAMHEVAHAIERGDRTVVPKGGERVLPFGEAVRVQPRVD
jgi:hypothetical protein